MFAYSELSLALSSVVRGPWLSGLAPREVLHAAASTLLPARGKHLTLDATAPGFRPRQLDHSARRDLASAIRRAELSLAGVDCFVPTEHLEDAATRDRAASAILAAVELAGQIGSPRTAFRAPVGVDQEIIESVRVLAERVGVVACCYGGDTALPRAVVADSNDPAELAQALHGAGVIRWKWPVAMAGTEAGVLAPLVATLGYVGTVDLDLSQAGDPESELLMALSRWSQAMPRIPAE